MLLWHLNAIGGPVIFKLVVYVWFPRTGRGVKRLRLLQQRTTDWVGTNSACFSHSADWSAGARGQQARFWAQALLLACTWPPGHCHFLEGYESHHQGPTLLTSSNYLSKAQLLINHLCIGGGTNIHWASVPGAQPGECPAVCATPGFRAWLGLGTSSSPPAPAPRPPGHRHPAQGWWLSFQWRCCFFEKFNFYHRHHLPVLLPSTTRSRQLT